MARWGVCAFGPISPPPGPLRRVGCGTFIRRRRDGGFADGRTLILGD
jgi:hypothetical protein